VDGAEIDVMASSISYNTMTQLYFSVDKDYRKNGKWLMNDEVAMQLRLIESENSAPLSTDNINTILQKYAEDNGFHNTEFFVDDGYLGTNFDRPDFQHLIEKVDNDEIGTVIVKDMSRLGRDYLKIGYYTKVAFPEVDIRFIAINNGVDSNNQQDSDFTPFLNIINVSIKYSTPSNKFLVM